MSRYIDILDFLMSNDVTIHCADTNRHLQADALYELGGEFTVYEGNSLPELYRGGEFIEAMKVLYGKELGE